MLLGILHDPVIWTFAGAFAAIIGGAQWYGRRAPDVYPDAGNSLMSHMGDVPFPKRDKGG